MAELPESTTFGLIALMALLPPLLFLWWIRNHEQHEREPVRAVLVTFLYGGSVGVGIAVALHAVFQFGFENTGSPIPTTAFLAAIVIAPIAEEFSKALGLNLVRKEMDELEDGIIYGAAIGLGFAATENFVYGLTALAADGFGASVVTIIVRVFSSMLLHGAASAIVGFGYALMVQRGGVVLELFPHYLSAVLLHALYNFLVTIDAGWGFLLAVFIVGVVLGAIRRQIKLLDAVGFERDALR